MCLEPWNASKPFAVGQCLGSHHAGKARAAKIIRTKDDFPRSASPIATMPSKSSSWSAFNFMQFFVREVTGGQWVSDAGDVDVTEKDEGIMTCQVTAVHNLGELVALGLENSGLLLLVARRLFVAAQQSMTLIGRQLLDADLVTRRASDKHVGAEVARAHTGLAIGSKLKPDVMEAALGQFQFAAGAPQKVMPQLGVEGHEAKQFIRGRLDVPFKMVGAIAGVINKAKHSESHRKRLIGGAKCSSIGLPCVAVTNDAGDESPMDRRVATACLGQCHGWGKLCSG